MNGRLARGGRPALRIPLDVDACLAFVALAALILSPVFGARAALVFLAAGLAMVALRPESSIGMLVRYRLLFVVPAFCMLSTLWSEFPALTLRYSVQLAITFAVAILIATRLAPGMLVRCLFAIYAIGVTGSVAFGRVRDDIGAWVGIFGSKNAFAAVVVGFGLTALALVLDRHASPWLRLVALGCALVAPPLLLLAQSAGALVTSTLAVAACLAVVASARLSAAQKLVVAVALVFGAVFVALGAATYADVILAGFLDATGKDVTLTGRTDLWTVGLELIADKPLLGTGYQAFWVHGHTPAETLWALFGIESRAGFNFHNTYISNAVEIGIVGVGLQVILLYGACAGVLRWALRSPSAESAFLAGYLTLVVATSFIEAIVFFQFSIASMVAVAAHVYGSRYRSWLRSGVARIADPAAPRRGAQAAGARP
jgi:exopolysaccharide production protein ExoQ